MGSWDYYCAICGSTFFTSSLISNKSLRARHRRRHRRAEERKARAEAKEKSKESKQVHEGAESNNRNDTNEVEPPSSDSETDVSSDTDEEFDRYDDYTHYDPEIITDEDVEWASVLKCIGFNDDLKKAFISGSGSAEDYGLINVDAGEDLNFPDEIEAACYEDANGLDPIFPFHVTCLDLFKKQFLHEIRNTYKKIKVEVIKDVSYDVLYDVMLQLGHGRTSCLGINYGPPAPPCHEQFWETNSGEEFFVADPMKQDARVTASILDAWEHCGLPESSHDRGHGVGRDLFSKLPVELLVNVTTSLQPTDLRNLILSSRNVYDITARAHNMRFWVQHFQLLMPWFFELNEFLEDTQRQGDLSRSLYRLFVWADQVSTPRIGMTGLFMGVANRRRIWGACSQISRAYIADSAEEELFEVDILQPSSTGEE